MPSIKTVKPSAIKKIAKEQSATVNREIYGKTAPKLEGYKAYLTKVNGSIKVPGKDNYVWHVPISGGQPSPVYNSAVAPQNNLRVIIGTKPGNNFYEVLQADTDAVATDKGTDSPLLDFHAFDHGPGGRDPLWIASNMFLPLTVYPSASGLYVNVYRGTYKNADGDDTVFTGATNVSMAPYMPGFGFYRAVGIGIDLVTNALQVISGNPVSASQSSSPPDPDWASYPDVQPLATVFLKSDLTRIAVTDIRDERTHYNWSVGGAGYLPGPNEIHVFYDDATYAKFTDLATASATADSGDIIVLGPNTTFLCDGIVFATGVKVYGTYATILQTTTDQYVIQTAVGGDLHVSDVKLVNAKTTGAVLGAYNNQGTLRMDRVEIEVLLSDSTMYGVYTYNGTTTLNQCRVFSGTYGVVNIDASGIFSVTNVFGGYLSGITADGYVSTINSTINVYGTYLEHGTLVKNAGFGNLGGDYKYNKLPYQITPHAVQLSNSSPVVLANGVVTAFPLNTEAYDPAGLHSTTVNNDRVTVQVPGLYACGGNLRYQANAAGVRDCGISINGVSVGFTRQGASGSIDVVAFAGAFYCNAGDIIRLTGFQNSGGNLTVDAVGYSPVLWVYRVF